MAEAYKIDPETGREIPKPDTKGVWKVFWLLLIVTGIEFLLAFIMPASYLRISIFVGLTLVKAFYIVAEFMHLGHEQRSLILSITLPVIFIFWFIIAMLTEGASILDFRGW